MAIGLSPKYILELPIDNLTRGEFLVVALETAKQLNWNIGYTSETGFIAHTKFSMFSWGEEFKLIIENDHANLKSECTGSQMMDWGRNKSNVENFVSKFNGLKGSFSADELAKKYIELKPGLVSKEEDELRRPPSSTKEKLTSVMSIFVPQKGFFVTPLIIDLNIAVFILMVATGVSFIMPTNQDLIKWGANFRPITLDGQWWRLITSCFLHIGIFHLLLNMYALLYVGLLLEPYLGRTRFAAAYLLTGIAGSAASLYWHDLTVCAGASGAIFGMYGVFLAMLTTNLIDKSARRTLLTSIVVFVGYNLVNGLKPGIDNAAHIGGLASGLFIGYASYSSLKMPENINLKYITVTILALLIITGSYFVYANIPNDVGTYDKDIKLFTTMENAALQFYRLPKDATKEQKLIALRDTGLYYWGESLSLVENMEQLKLPDEAHKIDRQLIEYCNFRMADYHFLYKAINENTAIYRDSIMYYNDRVQAMLDSLKVKGNTQE